MSDLARLLAEQAHHQVLVRKSKNRFHKCPRIVLMLTYFDAIKHSFITTELLLSVVCDMRVCVCVRPCVPACVRVCVHVLLIKDGHSLSSFVLKEAVFSCITSEMKFAKDIFKKFYRT